MKTVVPILALAAASLLPGLPGLPGAPVAAASGLSCCEQPLRWAPRHDTDEARLAITTEDGDVTLVLTSKVVAFQLSDRTFHKVDRELHQKRDEAEDDNPLAEAFVAAVLGGVRAMLDHSAECRIRDLRSVDYRDGELVFVTEDGERVFEDMEINDTEVAGGFSPEDARAFVREFRRLKNRDR